MKRHAELQVHKGNRSHANGENHCYMTHMSLLKTQVVRTNDKLGTWLYKEHEEPQDFFHRHYKISRQQTLETGPQMQTNIQAKI